MVNRSGSARVLRRGKSNAGCLVLTILVALACYIGVSVGRIYFRYYRFEDEMKQNARFAAQLTDSAIQSRLRITADSLGLPTSAQTVNVMRVGRSISISGSYAELVDLKIWKHYLHFSPNARANY